MEENFSKRRKFQATASKPTGTFGRDMNDVHLMSGYFPKML